MQPPGADVAGVRAGGGLGPIAREQAVVPLSIFADRSFESNNSVGIGSVDGDAPVGIGLSAKMAVSRCKLRVGDLRSGNRYRMGRARQPEFLRSLLAQRFATTVLGVVVYG